MEHADHSKSDANTVEIPIVPVGSGAITAVLESVTGAAAGAAIGLLAGPVGAAIGAVVGGVAATAAAGIAHEMEHERRAHDEELDREIGVDGGSIGEVSPDAPPPHGGAFSAASMGIHDQSRAPAEGPIPTDGE